MAATRSACADLALERLATTVCHPEASENASGGKDSPSTSQSITAQFQEERRAAGGNPLWGRSRQRAPAVKKPGAKNDQVIGPGEATRTLHQQRRQGLTTRAGRHLGRRRGSKRHRLKR
ncbi:hypothetical protein HPB50_011190 [Hyalomma asiaticum]|uniref:Uncharacterized protein n=1 Tax=Hyalomma asiaticum TaxID=266040 RepID=A0ACB7S2C1_HYAAI|nr:hypothetical protein HPB50_011190 [Hyalomma asiaticum]